jgi:hypothetical protein
VCLTQGRTGTLRNTGWRFDSAADAHTSMPQRLVGYRARLESVATRLARVSLECRPALDVVAAYGGRPGYARNGLRPGVGAGQKATSYGHPGASVEVRREGSSSS